MLANATRSIDVDTAIYSKAGEHCHFHMPPGGDAQHQSIAKAAEAAGCDKEAAAVRFIKEKYDSLGKIRIDRPSTADGFVTMPPDGGRVGGDTTVVAGGGGSSSSSNGKLTREYLPGASTSIDSGKLPSSSPYDIPTSTVCGRAPMPASVRTVASVGACCCNRAAAVAHSHVAPATCERQSQVCRHQQGGSTMQPCHHQPPHHQQSIQQQQQQVHRQCAGCCAHHVQHSYGDVPTAREDDAVQRHFSSTTSAVAGRQPTAADVAKTATSISATNAQQHEHRTCCRHQHDHQQQQQQHEQTRQSVTDLQLSPQHHQKLQTQQQAKSSVLAATPIAADTSDGSAESPPSLMLTDQEQAQIDLFYRGHKTTVHVCPAVARLSVSSPSAADGPVGALSGQGQGVMAVQPAMAVNSRFAGAASSSQLPSPPSVTDERNWTPTTVVGIPVVVHDSGAGRRRRCLSLVLAERGTGFETWRATIDRLSADYFRFDDAEYRKNADGVPDVGTASGAVHHVLRVREDDKGGNAEQRTTSGALPVRWARLTFNDRKSAGEFWYNLERLGAEIEGGGGGDTTNGGHHRKTKKHETSAAGKRKHVTVSKADISQPCCFSHVTRIERSEVAMSNGAASPSTGGGTGLRGILRSGFGGAVRGLAVARSVVIGSDATPSTNTDGTSASRR